MFLLLKVYEVFMPFENISTLFCKYVFCCVIYNLIYLMLSLDLYVSYQCSKCKHSYFTSFGDLMKIYLVIIYKVCIVHHIHLWVYVCIFPNNTLKVQRNTCVCNYRDYTFNADERNGDSQRRRSSSLFLFFYTLYTMKLSWNTAYKLYFSYQTIRHALHSSIP